MQHCSSRELNVHSWPAGLRSIAFKCKWLLVVVKVPTHNSYYSNEAALWPGPGLYVKHWCQWFPRETDVIGNHSLPLFTSQSQTAGVVLSLGWCAVFINMLCICFCIIIIISLDSSAILDKSSLRCILGVTWLKNQLLEWTFVCYLFIFLRLLGYWIIIRINHTLIHFNDDPIP